MASETQLLCLDSELCNHITPTHRASHIGAPVGGQGEEKRTKVLSIGSSVL